MSSETEESEEFFDALEDSISIVSRSSASSITRPKEVPEDDFLPQKKSKERDPGKSPSSPSSSTPSGIIGDVYARSGNQPGIIREVYAPPKPAAPGSSASRADDAKREEEYNGEDEDGEEEESEGLRDPEGGKLKADQLRKAEEVEGGKLKAAAVAEGEGKLKAEDEKEKAEERKDPAKQLLSPPSTIQTKSSRTSSFSDLSNPDHGPKTSDLDLSQIPTGPLAYYDETGEFVLMLKNLDTGEYVPLKQVEEELNRHALDPVTLNVLRRLEEDGGDFPLTTTDSEPDSQVENEPEEMEEVSQVETVLGKAKQKTKNLWEKFKSKATKSTLDEGHGAASSDEEDVSSIKYIKTNTHDKSKKEYNRLLRVQDLGGHTGPVWALKFSVDGKFLATGGQDTILRVWGLTTEPQAPTTDKEKEKEKEASANANPQKKYTPSAIFHGTPLVEFKGHTADILDVSWSKNNFLISSSMDKTVRLWHLTRKEALCVFQHNDFVTSVQFHPLDDRFFLSGSMDGKLRIWNIPEKKVAFWNETPGSSIITAVSFTAAGDVALAGTYLGVLFFYETQGLTYMTQINVTTSRGKTRSKKITGIDNVPGEEQIMVSSNDSRLRQYHLNDKSLACKFRGNVNMYSQIRASFRDDGAFVVCGSEDQKVYIWSSSPEIPTNPGMFSGFRRDRNQSYESFHAHDEVVTAAVFAPSSVKRTLEETFKRLPPVNANENSVQGDIIVTADYSGAIRVFENDRIRHHKSNSSLGRSNGSEVAKELDSQRPRSYSGSEVSPPSSASSPPSLSIPGIPSGTESGLSSVSNTPVTGTTTEPQKWKINFPGFPKGKEKEAPKEQPESPKELVCPNCGGKNLKTFGLVDDPGKKKKKKDEFRACLDCDVSWKI